MEAELAELIREGRAKLIGPIRQELLSGVREQAQFDRLRGVLGAFPDIALDTRDYEDAASATNRCVARGVQGSAIDFLICAVAMHRQMTVFTTDGDFQHFASVIPLTLHESRKPI